MDERYYRYRTAASTYNSDGGKAIFIGLSFIGIGFILAAAQAMKNHAWRKRFEKRQEVLQGVYGQTHVNMSPGFPEVVYVRFDEFGLPVDGYSEYVR